MDLREIDYLTEQNVQSFFIVVPPMGKKQSRPAVKGDFSISPRLDSGNHLSAVGKFRSTVVLSLLTVPIIEAFDRKSPNIGKSSFLFHPSSFIVRLHHPGSSAG
jgi:hypothetical protein